MGGVVVAGACPRPLGTGTRRPRGRLGPGSPSARRGRSHSDSRPSPSRLATPPWYVLPPSPKRSLGGPHLYRPRPAPRRHRSHVRPGPSGAARAPAVVHVGDPFVAGRGTGPEASTDATGRSGGVKGSLPLRNFRGGPWGIPRKRAWGRGPARVTGGDRHGRRVRGGPSQLTYLRARSGTKTERAQGHRAETPRPAPVPPFRRTRKPHGKPERRALLPQVPVGDSLWLSFLGTRDLTTWPSVVSSVYTGDISI